MSGGQAEGTSASVSAMNNNIPQTTPVLAVFKMCTRSEAPTGDNGSIQKLITQPICCYRILNSSSQLPSSASSLTSSTTTTKSSSSTSNHLLLATAVSTDVCVCVADSFKNQPAAPCLHSSGVVIVPAIEPNRLIIGKINVGSLLFEPIQDIDLSSDLDLILFSVAFNEDGTQFATLDSSCLFHRSPIQDHI